MPSPASPASATPHARSVLVVDDEPAIAGCLSEFLRRRGYDAVSAGDGDIALALLGARRWDVVVIDLLLGRGIPGDVVLARASAGDPELHRRTIFTTGDISIEAEQRIAASRPYSLLRKPFSLVELLDAVRAIAGGDGEAARARGQRRA